MQENTEIWSLSQLWQDLIKANKPKPNLITKKSNIMYIKSFIDLEQCLDYLKSLGCKDEKVFGKLAKNSICTYKETTIIYDPYKLLEF